VCRTSATVLEMKKPEAIHRDLPPFCSNLVDNDRLLADSAGSHFESKMATSGSAFDAEIVQRIKVVKESLAVRISIPSGNVEKG